MLLAGPTPMLWYIGVTTSGNASAKQLRKNVFAAIADAAYMENVSTR
jgi:hypothetical protein